MSGTYAVFSGVARLTRDCELKYTTGGAAVCHFAVATDHKEKKEGNWTDSPSFWEVDLWGKLAESLAPYLLKGKLIHLAGEQWIEKWTKDGVTSQKVKINAATITLLPSGDSSGKPAQPAGRPATQPASKPAEEFTDDIPF